MLPFAERQADTDPEWIDIENGRLALWPDFVRDHQRLYDELVAAVAWEQPEVRVYGRMHLTPRLVAFYGDADAGYTYSGLHHEPLPWLESLAHLRDIVQRATGYGFNCVLANWYRSGQDSMGLHSDDEPELGRNPAVASVSLGAVRRFVLKPKKTGAACALELPAGSLLLMSGPLQHHWRHGLPRQLSVKEGRINLTFRNVIRGGAS